MDCDLRSGLFFLPCVRAPGRHLTPFPEVPHKLQIIEGFFLMCCGKLLEMRLLNMLVLAHIFRHVHVVLLTRAGFDLGSCCFPGAVPKNIHSP